MSGCPKMLYISSGYTDNLTQFSRLTLYTGPLKGLKPTSVALGAILWAVYSHEIPTEIYTAAHLSCKANFDNQSIFEVAYSDETKLQTSEVSIY